MAVGREWRMVIKYINGGCNWAFYEDEYLFLFVMLIQEKWDEVDAKYCII